MDTKKTLSTITAGILSVAMCGSFVSFEQFKSSDVEAVTEMSAIELVNDMGSGWNLGNTLDPQGVTWLNPLTVEGFETAWGNPTTTKDMIKTLHEDYGFNTIRIPTTWNQFIDDNDNYKIDEAFLNRVQQIVDWCQEESMYAIVDMHWDDCNLDGGGKNWLGTADDSFNAVETRYTAIWNQIADHFKDYDNKLVFESNNEPSISNESLMKLNQDFVDIFRSSSDNNKDRLLLISSPEANLDMACSSTFSMPNDDSNMLAVSVHYYYPSTFCVYPSNQDWGGLPHKNTWGDSSDVSEMVNNFEKLKKTYTDKGIPVILGEYGVVTDDVKETASIEKFVESVATYSKSYDGISAVIWDSGGHNYNEDKMGNMEFFDRKNLTFFNENIGSMFKKLNSGGGSIQGPTFGWVETEIVDDGEVLYVETKGSSKFKVEATGVPNSTGTGVIGYWDNTLNAWVGDKIYIKYSADDDGNVTFDQTDSKYSTVINEGFFELPEGANTSNFQVQIYYSASYDNSIGDMVECESPTLTKAYMWGVVTETTNPDNTTTSMSTVTTSVSDPDPIVTTTNGESNLPKPDFKNLFGYVYPSFSNGVVDQWEIDGDLSEPVAITGNGSYTLTIKIPEGGAAETIQFLALSSTLNHYQQNEDDKEIMSDLTFTIDSILVDGQQIEYVASKDALGRENDGNCYRMSIYDDWTNRNVQDINPLVVNTDSIVINFTIDGIVEDGTPQQTTTSSLNSDITTSSSDGYMLGDANCDGQVRNNDVQLIRQSILHLIDDFEEGSQAFINSDVNKDGSIRNNDVQLIRQYILHLIDDLENPNS